MAQRPICIAIMALGGQGGGVLSSWLLALAEANGWRAQTTSVPGVAQRTGATIYYVEIFPEGEGQPVLALMPTPGAVDLVVAAELMEAGRAIQRGFVSPDRTVLIASEHRAYAVSEKSVPGYGAADSDSVLHAARASAKRFIHADMARLAESAGSVISASLLGAIAGSGVLPFSRQAFESTIEAGGVGVQSSLAAFAAGFDAVTGVTNLEVAAPAETRGLAGGSAEERRRYQTACQRIDSEFPASAREMLQAGLDAVVDFQDARYGDEYLDRMTEISELDQRLAGAESACTLTSVAAKYLAGAMTYDDVIRVAELKTRGQRFARVHSEVGVASEQIVHVTEFMHPRLEEVCSTLPAGLGRAIERRRLLSRLLRGMVDRGRRVRTDSLFGFLLLYGVAGLRRWRRSSLRHHRETAHLEQWLDQVRQAAAADYALAVEVLKCRRLIKGYSDTHARGIGKYDKVLSALPALRGRTDAAERLATLREAALQDEAGKALDKKLATLIGAGNQATRAVA